MEFASHPPRQIITKRGQWASPVVQKYPGVIVRCCQCGRVKAEGGKWEKRIIVREHTDTYCPHCFQEQLTELENLRKEKLCAV